MMHLGVNVSCHARQHTNKTPVVSCSSGNILQHVIQDQILFILGILVSTTLMMISPRTFITVANVGDLVEVAPLTSPGCFLICVSQEITHYGVYLPSYIPHRLNYSASVFKVFHK